MTASKHAVEPVPVPPPTRRFPLHETLHGVEITDPYRWLEDQDHPDTRAWIAAQNAHTKSLLNELSCRAAIRQRLEALLKIDSVSAPIERGGFYYFTRRRADQELGVLCRRRGRKGRVEVLIDPHPMSPDHTTSVGIWDVSHDGALLAYGVREGGVDEVTLRLRDVAAGTDLPDALPKARYFGLALKPDRSGFYYVRHDETGSRVRYHALGTDPSADTEVFGAGYGPEKIIEAGLSDDGRYLLIGVYFGSAARKTEVWLLDVVRGGPSRPIVTDLDARFHARIGGDTLFVETDWNAPNGRILSADVHAPARENWREIVPESRAALQWFTLTGGRLCVGYLEDVRSRVTVFEPDGARVRDLALPALGSVGEVSGRWDSREAFFSFSSFPVPPILYRYDVETGQRSVWARLKAPVRSGDFVVKQVRFGSRDGTQVPMFLVHRKGLKRDGVRPVYLTGYGGFNASMTPSFSAVATLWAEHGGVFAVPNLRGGGEFGEEWHRAGMLGNKQNTFDDFLAAAEWLIHHRYTHPERLAIAGGSNGGLLVGAAMTQRPDLFRAVVCAVPLLDMLRYHRFLVAGFWVPEYGSADDPEQFRWLHAYSPYHHVQPGVKYPAVLFTTGDADTRVAPLHARKMTALLQAATGSDRPVLLHYDTKAGHSGGKPLSQYIEDQTEELAFLFWQLGLETP